MKITLTLGIGTFLILAASHAIAAGCSDNSPEPEPATSPSAGVMAYIDPQTGELTEPPPGSLPSASVTAGDSAQAPARLPQTVSPDGTITVELGNRFMTELHAEVIDGKIVTCHRPTSQASDTTEADNEQP